jgi:hypothetical protein
MKYIHCLVFLLIHAQVFSQQKFSKEISLLTDNDLFVSVNKDRYYTNGLFLSYRYIAENKKEKEEKRIIEWQLGHEMFTPYKAIVPNISQHDRPFAAYLYGSFGIHRFYKNNRIFNTSLQVGVLGPAAFGKDVQDFIHDMYNFDMAVGWKHQIKNSFGLNLNVSYLKHILNNASNYVDISWLNEGKIGTIYTNISSGFYSRIGFKPLQKIVNSIAFNGSLNNKSTAYQREGESFIYIHPMLRYALYDATLEGSFLNANNDVTKELTPLQFHVAVGFRCTINRFNLGYSYQYHTNKSKGLKYDNGNKYGSIVVNYLLR